MYCAKMSRVNAVSHIMVMRCRCSSLGIHTKSTQRLCIFRIGFTCVWTAQAHRTGLALAATDCPVMAREFCLCPRWVHYY